MVLLRREVDMLCEWDEDVVIEVDVPEHAIRQDGFMSARAKVASERVAVSFDSRHGPLRYECGTFGGTYNYPAWQNNVRAIALGLEALRKVTRYGIGARGEQYTGWAQLGPGGALMTFDEAARLLIVESGMVPVEDYPPDKITPLDARVMYRRAAKIHHPDAGGNPDTFNRIKQAYDLLTGAS